MRKQIIVKIREVAESRGITSAYGLQQRTNFSPTVANRLWFGKTTRFSIEVLEALCIVLECQPGDLFVYASNANGSKPVSAPELSKAQSAPVSNVKDVQRRLRELSSVNVKASNGALVESDNVASDNETLLSTADVAGRLGINERTVRDNYNNGKLPFVKCGTKNLVRESDFIAFRDSRNSA